MALMTEVVDVAAAVESVVVAVVVDDDEVKGMRVSSLRTC